MKDWESLSSHWKEVPVSPLSQHRPDAWAKSNVNRYLGWMGVLGGMVFIAALLAYFVLTPHPNPVTAVNDASTLYSQAQALRLGKPLRYGQAGALLLQQASKAGDLEAMTDLALCQIREDGLPWDIVAAMGTMRRAAEAGHWRAQMIYGEYQYYGIAMDVNSVAGLHWLEKAAESGKSQALFTLGSVLVRSEEKDSAARGIKLLQQVAAAGFLSARAELGYWYIRGENLPKDEEGGLKMIRECALAGDAYAQLKLCEYLGSLAVKNPEELHSSERYEWAFKAAQQDLGAAIWELAYMDNPAHAHSPAEAQSERRMWMRRAGRLGFTPCMVEIGLDHLRGPGVIPNAEEAVRWLRLASDFGDLQGQTYLALLLISGEGVPQDLEEARKLCQAVMSREHAGGYAAMGKVLAAESKGNPTILAEAVQHYRRAVELDERDPDGCLYLARCLRYGHGVSKNVTAAVENYIKAANGFSQLGNHAEASYELGQMYEFGESMPRDIAKAYASYQQASWSDHAPACFRLWQLDMEENHREELGFIATEESSKYLRQSAALGYIPAQTRLGKAHLEDRLTFAQDPQEALHWLRRAAEKKDPEAMHYIGLCYGHGLGVKKNLETAATWTKAAAELGWAEAQCQLGNCYMKGAGTPKNLTEGMRWFKKAADQGSVEGNYSLGMYLVKGSDSPTDMKYGLQHLLTAAQADHPAAIALLIECYSGQHGYVPDETQRLNWVARAAALQSKPVSSDSP
ncbi:TPR repeat protein [Prosthecobacter fusiformis]|uniref:TPR repeat protein n=2 Tax=Prosthecobacter fusiformis TaxID=48464 RepID=A0A4R7RII5_9BACT|nr:TPR repeat protein [Prosthecobacter fusiformis]